MARLTSTTVPDASLRPLATLRPHGFGRFFVAAFLLLWLMGWAAGEVTVLGIIGAAVGAALGLLPDEHVTRFAFEGSVGFGAVFISVWLALWTLGGVGALAMLARLLFGVEEVLVGVAGLVVRTGVGPFRRERVVPRDAIFHVGLVGADVTATLVGEQWRLATLGTPAERSALAAAITETLGSTNTSLDAARVREPPTPFTVNEHDGELRLLRRVRAWPVFAVAAPVAAFCALSLLRALRVHELDDVPSAALLGGVALVLSIVAVRAREVGFIVRAATLHERRGVLRTSDRALSTTLIVRRHVDSEGDERFELRAGTDVVLRDTSAAPCLHLGHFLAARLGTPLREENN